MHREAVNFSQIIHSTNQVDLLWSELRDIGHSIYHGLGMEDNIRSMLAELLFRRDCRRGFDDFRISFIEHLKYGNEFHH